MNCCVGLFFYLFILCIYYTKKFLQNQAVGPQKLRIKLNFKLTSYAPAFNLAICYLTLSYLDPNSIFREIWTSFHQLFIRFNAEFHS
jgi:hypothetical protein